MKSLKRLGALGALVGFALCTAVEARRLEPTEMPDMGKRLDVGTFDLTDTRDAHRVVALPLTQSIEAAQTLKRSSEKSHKREQVGWPRELENGSIELASLNWSVAPGGYAATVLIDADGALAGRFAYSLLGGQDTLSVRVGSASEAVYVQALDGETRWTPVLDGTLYRLEVFAKSKPSSGVLELSQFSHLIIDSKGLKDTRDIGRAASCIPDVACVTNPSNALTQAAKSVAKMVFTSGGSSFRCTGTLLTSRDASDRVTNIPYFITAAHCIATAAEAASLTTYWFFDAGTCNSKSIPPFQQVGGGALLVYQDQRLDASLLRLNAAPPTGAVFSAWDDNMIASGENVIAIHHSSGDLKKYSAGTTFRYVQDDVVNLEGTSAASKLGSFMDIQWTTGFTEGGSSGSGIFGREFTPIANYPDGYYYLRGTLSQGPTFSCTASNAGKYDDYARFDLFAPIVIATLDPKSAPPALDGNTAIEFYNVTLDHYFVEARASEVTAVDAQREFGWYRTGQRFGVWASPIAGSQPFCRFYGDKPNGGPNSHFFTINAGECAFVRTTRGWLYEGLAFNAFEPNAIGACANANAPKQVFRLFNNGQNTQPIDPIFGRLASNSNHRFTTSTGIAAIMASQGWTLEGSGRAVFCGR